MMRLPKILITLAVVMLPALGAVSAQAQATAVDEEERARSYFSNLELVNQDGQTVQFFDDVMKDKVVGINFVFTNCKGACPQKTHKLTLLRDKLEGYVGKP